MKKFFFIVALLGCALVYLQQQSYAEKVAHKEYAKMAIKECSECHKGEGVAPNHGSDYVREHRVLASKAGKNCSQCHEQKWCLDCHQGGGSGDNLSVDGFNRDYKPKSHRSDFINIHALKAKDNMQQCYRCHDAKAFCYSCHSKFPIGNDKFGNRNLRIKSHNILGINTDSGNGNSNFNGTSTVLPGMSQPNKINNQKYSFALGEHALEARRNLQSCQACHPDGDVCIQCHSSKGNGTNPHPSGFKKDNYRDRSNGKVCQKCHLPGTGRY